MNRLTQYYSCKNANNILAALGIDNTPEEDVQIIKCENELCCETCHRVENCEECPINEAIEKLAEYEDAEEQGLLLRLPCKPGDIVYVFLARLSVFEFQVVDFIFDSKKRLVMRAEQPGKRGRRYQFFFEDYDKILFLTKEAAEAELIKRQEGE